MYTTPKRCPKCGYERQPADTVPDWQCPSCGVAYNKVENAPAIRIDSIEAVEAPPRSGWTKWAVIALAVVGVSILFANLGNRSDRGAVAAAAQPEVVMYATYWCGYCAAARAFFEKHGIAYSELDVEKDAQAAQLNRQLGGGGVPTILVDDQIVRGFDKRYLTELLKPWMK